MAETDKDDLVSIIDDDDKNIHIPNPLPLIPVRDVVIFTDMLLPLFIGRERSVRAIEEALKQDRLLLLATQKDPGTEEPSPEQRSNLRHGNSRSHIENTQAPGWTR